MTEWDAAVAIIEEAKSIIEGEVGVRGIVWSSNGDQSEDDINDESHGDDGGSDKENKNGGNFSESSNADHPDTQFQANPSTKRLLTNLTSKKSGKGNLDTPVISRRSRFTQLKSRKSTSATTPTGRSSGLFSKSGISSPRDEGQTSHNRARIETSGHYSNNHTHSHLTQEEKMPDFTCATPQNNETPHVRNCCTSRDKSVKTQRRSEGSSKRSGRSMLRKEPSFFGQTVVSPPPGVSPRSWLNIAGSTNSNLNSNISPRNIPNVQNIASTSTLICHLKSNPIQEHNPNLSTESNPGKSTSKSVPSNCSKSHPATRTAIEKTHLNCKSTIIPNVTPIEAHDNKFGSLNKSEEVKPTHDLNKYNNDNNDDADDIEDDDEMMMENWNNCLPASDKKNPEVKNQGYLKDNTTILMARQGLSKDKNATISTKAVDSTNTNGPIDGMMCISENVENTANKCSSSIQKAADDPISDESNQLQINARALMDANVSRDGGDVGHGDFSDDCDFNDDDAGFSFNNSFVLDTQTVNIINHGVGNHQLDTSPNTKPFSVTNPFNDLLSSKDHLDQKANSPRQGATLALSLRSASKCRYQENFAFDLAEASVADKDVKKPIKSLHRGEEDRAVEGQTTTPALIQNSGAKLEEKSQNNEDNLYASLIAASNYEKAIDFDDGLLELSSFADGGDLESVVLEQEDRLEKTSGGGIGVVGAAFDKADMMVQTPESLNQMSDTQLTDDSLLAAIGMHGSYSYPLTPLVVVNKNNMTMTQRSSCSPMTDSLQSPAIVVTLDKRRPSKQAGRYGCDSERKVSKSGSQVADSSRKHKQNQSATTKDGFVKMSNSLSNNSTGDDDLFTDSFSASLVDQAVAQCESESAKPKTPGKPKRKSPATERIKPSSSSTIPGHRRNTASKTQSKPSATGFTRVQNSHQCKAVGNHLMDSPNFSPILQDPGTSAGVDVNSPTSFDSSNNDSHDCVPPTPPDESRRSTLLSPAISRSLMTPEKSSRKSGAKGGGKKSKSNIFRNEHKATMADGNTNHILTKTNSKNNCDSDTNFNSLKFTNRPVSACGKQGHSEDSLAQLKGLSAHKAKNPKEKCISFSNVDKIDNVVNEDDDIGEDFDLDEADNLNLIGNEDEDLIDDSLSRPSSPPPSTLLASHLLTQQSFTIIDVCADRQLFKTFIQEWRSQPSFAIALACEKMPTSVTRDKTPTVSIGGKFLKKHRPESSKATETPLGLPVPDSDVMMVGMAVAWQNRDAYFISFMESNPEGDPNDSLAEPCLCDSLSVVQRLAAVCDVFKFKTDKRSPTVNVYDAKTAYSYLAKTLGLSLSACHDPRVADWLKEQGGRLKNLHRMVITFLPEEVSLLEAVGGVTSYQSLGNDVKSKISGRIRACTESVLTGKLMAEYRVHLEKEELWDAFCNTEMPSLVTLARMELNGFGLNLDHLETQKDLMMTKLERLEHEAYRLAGHAFSLTSTDDIARVLYLDLKLPINGDPTIVRKLPDRTSKRKSFTLGGTSKEILEKLEKFHLLPSIVLEWRRISSALTKSVFALQKAAKRCSRLNMMRIFGECNMFSSTGRVSLSEPNVQNIPKDFSIQLPDQGSAKNQTSQQILTTPISLRTLFVAFDDAVILAADYSQLELRIIAHLSADKRLIQILNCDDGDVFKMIAAQMKSVDVCEVTASDRQQAKQVCYGMLYGIGAKALGQTLGMEEEDAFVFMDTFKSSYPGVRKYLRETVEFCQKNGYVKTLFNRRRYLPSIKHNNPHARAHAERQAVNTSIQGSAADLVKKAMVSIDRKLMHMFPQTCVAHSQATHYKAALNDTYKSQGSSKTTSSSSSSQISLPPNGAFFVLQLHDELIYEVSQRHVSTVARLVKEEMEKSVDLHVKMPVKVKVGESWGHLEDYEVTGSNSG